VQGRSQRLSAAGMQECMMVESCKQPTQYTL
jgi:hypothetical protein